VLLLYRLLDRLLILAAVLTRFIFVYQTVLERLLVEHPLKRLPQTALLLAILYSLVIVVLLDLLETRTNALD